MSSTLVAPSLPSVAKNERVLRLRRDTLESQQPTCPHDRHASKSQNQLEQEALLAVVRALPEGVRPVVLADRGFRRASFLRWLQEHSLDYVVRIKKGSCLTGEDGHRWKLGEEGLKPGQLRFCEDVRYGLYHDRPRDLWINVALCLRVPKSKWRDPRRQVPAEPW